MILDKIEYIFTPGAANVGTIELLTRTLELSEILHIQNVTKGKEADMYVSGEPLLGGSLLANIITLEVDTSSMLATDDLQIIVETKTVEGMTKVVTIPELFEIGEFEVNGHVPVRIEGHNPVLPSLVDTDISELGVVIIPLPSKIGVVMELVSTVAGDLDETRATGTVTLTGGISGSVNTLTINAIDIMYSSVPFNTDLSTTAADVVSNINKNTNNIPAGYTASNVGAVITISAPIGKGITENGLIVLVTTTTITTTSVNMAGGINGGVGAFKVFVAYLIADGTQMTELLSCNGITPVVLNGGLPIRRVNNLHIHEVGINLVAAGDVSIRDTATGLINYRIIKVGQVKDRTCLWTVPKGKTAVIIDWKPSVGAGKETKFGIKSNSTFHPGGAIILQEGLWVEHDQVVVKDSSVPNPKRMPLMFNELTDIKISGVDLGGGLGVAYSVIELYYE